MKKIIGWISILSSFFSLAEARPLQNINQVAVDVSIGKGSRTKSLQITFNAVPDTQQASTIAYFMWQNVTPPFTTFFSPADLSPGPYSNENLFEIITKAGVLANGVIDVAFKVNTPDGSKSYLMQYPLTIVDGVLQSMDDQPASQNGIICEFATSSLSSTQQKIDIQCSD